VTFIINPDGIIAWRFLSLKPRDRPKVEDVISALDVIVTNVM
jgi:peroxiredoxin